VHGETHEELVQPGMAVSVRDAGKTSEVVLERIGCQERGWVPCPITGMFVRERIDGHAQEFVVVLVAFAAVATVDKIFRTLILAKMPDDSSEDIRFSHRYSVPPGPP